MTSAKSFSIPVFCSHEKALGNTGIVGRNKNNNGVRSEAILSCCTPFDASRRILSGLKHPSHDVPCVGYRIHTPDGKTMTIATDLGVLTPPVHEALSGCDLVALESNYDLHMLRSGPYPYYLRARIESVRGHLSNDECSAKLLELIQSGCKKFALCHLSQENNTPSLALQTVFTTLGAAGVVPEKDCIVQAQRRNEVSPALTF